MKKAEHLTEEQFNRYRHRTWRRRNCSRWIGTSRSARRVSPACGGNRTPFRRCATCAASFREHLDYDQIVACAEGAASGPCERHLAECELCRAEVDDLRDFRAQLTLYAALSPR